MLFQLLTISLLVLSLNCHASDTDKEKRWADQISDSIFDGDVIWLNDGQANFLGIYTTSQTANNRAVILMHGTGIHPDWPLVIQPLRIGLIEHNWHTLSIQMPILPNEAQYSAYAPLYDEVAPRINAAIQYLLNAGINDIVLIGHSQGATMAAYYLSLSSSQIKGFIALGMGTFSDDLRMNSINSLEKINIPILDISAQNDLEGITNTSKQRATAAITAGNKQFRQTVIPGDHFYDGHETALMKTVADWLEKLRY